MINAWGIKRRQPTVRRRMMASFDNVSEGNVKQKWNKEQKNTAEVVRALVSPIVSHARKKVVGDEGVSQQAYQ
jgi:hypothetical protein